ncbi:hypothetical protein ACETAC_05970 [Aceticella autotrophica]|uniref:Uncharacterized protein n=1 Tax=Aceticella autotrophica TaxID=2755338 RepID=A0A975ATQ8_9THEO|nr:hypothetical protein [Aceticella autotrophica]QSZ26471.1 hypothetical protein ACETAC_05970 [Aceticella autotrophica]
MNKFEKIYFPLIILISTTLLNVLMILQTIISKKNYDIFSNVFVIIVVIFLYQINCIAIRMKKERQVRLEYYGILALFAVSLMRFVNRFTILPFYINITSIILFVGFETFALMIAVIRIIKR